MKRLNLSAGIQVCDRECFDGLHYRDVYANIARYMSPSLSSRELRKIHEIAQLNGWDYDKDTDKLVFLDWEIWHDMSDLVVPKEIHYLPAKWFTDIVWDQQHKEICIPATDPDWDPDLDEGDGKYILVIDCLFSQESGERFSDALERVTRGNVTITQRKEV